MKTMILAILAFSAHAAAAPSAPSDTDLTVTCFTGFPTTTFLVAPTGDGKNVTVRVYHHNGTDYMPIHSGVVVPHDFTLLSKRAKELTSLGNDYQFSFPREKCEVIADMVLHCSDFKAEAQTINGRTVRGFSFYSTASREVSFAGTYDYLDLTMFIDIDGESYFQPMRYDRPDCVHARPNRGEIPPLALPTLRR